MDRLFPDIRLNVRYAEADRFFFTALLFREIRQDIRPADLRKQLKLRGTLRRDLLQHFPVPDPLFRQVKRERRLRFFTGIPEPVSDRAEKMPAAYVADFGTDP